MLLFSMLITSVLLLLTFFHPQTKQYWKVIVSRIRSITLVAIGFLLIPATMLYVDLLPMPINDLVAGIMGGVIVTLFMPFMTAEKILTVELIGFGGSRKRERDDK